MPKKGNAKPNAFLFFMLDWKKKEEKNGRTFPGGISDVQTDPECNKMWREMSDAEKSFYKAKCKSTPSQKEKKKLTGLGESIDEVSRAEMKKTEFKDNMQEYIRGLINYAQNQNNIHKLEFYVIHVNYFYKRTLETNEVEYYPAEIAIAEFSLDKGVKRIYHEIISEKVLIGFTCDAKSHSAETHQIPIEAKFGKSNYREIFNDICKFLQPGKVEGQYPPLYTFWEKDNVRYPVESVLGRLAASDGRSDQFFRVYSYEELFSHVYNATNEQSEIKMETIVAKVEILKDRYAYKKGIECEYHSGLDSNKHYCSQSYVQRWIFELCTRCCPTLGIELIQGCHIPKHNQPELSIRMLSSSISTMSLNESQKAISIKSMTGVTDEYRAKVSERTFHDEMKRRKEALDKPIKIIDHSFNHTRKLKEPIERPLRPPHTKSAVPSYIDTTDSESIDLASECSFPSIGRGTVIKKRLQESKLRPGYAWGDRSKS